MRPANERRMGGGRGLPNLAGTGCARRISRDGLAVMMPNQTGKVIPFRSRASKAQETADLAFAYWRERLGIEEGSPEEDLIRAQREMRRRSIGRGGLSSNRSFGSMKKTQNGG